MIDIIEEDTSAVIRSLKDYVAEVAYASYYHLSETGFKIFPITEDELVLVVNKSSPFAKRKSIELSEAAHEEFLFLGAFTAVSHYGIDQCAKAGFVPKSVNTMQSNMTIPTIVDLISKGAGVALLMRKTAEHYANQNVRIVRLSGRPAMYSGLITRDETLSTACRQFICFATEFFGCTDKKKQN